MNEEIWAKFAEMAEEIRKRNGFVVVHHYDADGINAGAIIGKALEREGKKVKFLAVKQLYSETIKEIKGLGTNYVFVDFGSGQLDLLKKEFEENFFVIDHHQPIEEEYRFHLNPFHFGVNGGTEISGAGMVYFLAKALNEKNADLSALAVVGAVGDMQDFSGRLIGLNREVLLQAEKNGVIKKETDLRLYGRISRPLIQYLMFSSNPILPELTANEKNCAGFLQELGIELKQGEKWQAYNDLSAEEKKKLTSALIVHLRSYNVPEWKAKELIGEVYTLLKEKAGSPLRDAKEFATLCNSCGRHGKGEIALAVCLGDREEKYGQALSLLAQHRKELREGIEFIKEKGVEEQEEFYFFDAGTEIKDSLVGIVAGMLYGSGAIESNKPIIALGRNEDGSIKLSARATKELVQKGLNLGKILKEICAELGEENQGGGHMVAAGAKIQAEHKEKFLERLNERIKQLWGN